jgi:L-ribulose-5-phosphate 3-epimerase
VFSLDKPLTMGLYEKALEPELSWNERLDTAAKLGFDFVEISIDETDGRMDRVQKRSENKLIKEAISSSGIPISTMCLSGHRKFPIGSTHPDVRNRGMDLMARAIEFSVDVGIRVVQLAGYDVYYNETSTPESRHNFLENLQKSVELAGRAGVMLAFENMGGPYIDTLGKAMEYVNSINSPWLQIYGDIGNLHAIKADVAYELTMAGKHLIGLHVKDTVPGVIRDIPFGEGSTPFEESFTALEKSGFSGFYVMEMWYRKGEDNIKIIKDAKNFIENKMAMTGLPV